MKIEKINYQRAYVTGPFLQDKLGIEISIDQGLGETPEMAYSLAKEIMDNWHKQANPHLEGTTITDVPGEPPRTLEIMNNRIANEEQRIEAIISDINSCTEIKVLESYRLMVKSNERLQNVYNLKMASLQLDKNLKDMEGNWPGQQTTKQ